MNDEQKKTVLESPIPAAVPDANVATDGHCLLTDTAEQIRPNTGEPCRDGRDGD